MFTKIVMLTVVIHDSDGSNPVAVRYTGAGATQGECKGLGTLHCIVVEDCHVLYAGA